MRFTPKTSCHMAAIREGNKYRIAFWVNSSSYCNFVGSLFPLISFGFLLPHLLLHPYLHVKTPALSVADAEQLKK